MDVAKSVEPGFARSADDDVAPHPVTLGFPEPLESEFFAAYCRDSLMHVRIAALLGLVQYCAFGALDALLFPSLATRLWLVRYSVTPAIILAFLALTFTRHYPRLMQAGIALVGLSAGLSVVALLVVTRPVDTYYAGVLLLQLYLYAFFKLRFVYATAVCWTVLLAYQVVAIAVLHTPAAQLVSNDFFVVGANLIGMFACWFIERYTRLDFLQRRTIAREREKAERLLRNIFPEAIADRLKEGEASIADHFGEATILFADIVDFTTFAARVAPGEVVSLLNSIFSTFDRLAEKHGLEKIKTIGDAYMAVCGLPSPRADHAVAVAGMALEMIEEAARVAGSTGHPLTLRIGISTGPVVAGVIGKKRFIYDLWGDAVNTASRMESLGLPGRIQVSAETWRHLDAAGFRGEPRGAIAVKGKGQMTTFLLVGRALAPAEQS